MSELTYQIGTTQVTLDRLNERLGMLIKKGEAIRVTDVRSCLAAKQFRVECKGYEKAVDLYADGDIQDASERLSKLRAAKKILLAPVLAVLDVVDKNRRTWEEQERQAAEHDVENLRESFKKQGRSGEPIEVRPAIPTLEGTQSRRRYCVKLNDPDAVLEDWAKAKAGRTKKDQYRAMFLRSYLRVDEAAIQAAARSEEGWKKLKAEKIHGLKFWTE